MKQRITWPKKYLSESDENIFIDLWRSKGYSGELETLIRDERDWTIIMLKEAVHKKMGLRVTGD